MAVDQPKPDPGIFIVEGGSISLSSISFWIDSDGSVKSSPVEVSLRTDVCPIWLGIALDQVLAARAAAEDIQAAREKRDDSAVGGALTRELNAGMQVAVAAGIALDAFYSLVKPYAGIPSATQRSWSKTRTARHKQMSETFRVAFRLREGQHEKVAGMLGDVLKWRDMAVHPNQVSTAPALHLELNKMVDRRFATFRYPNSRDVLKYSLALIIQLARRESAGDLSNLCVALVRQVEPLRETWDAEFGALLPSSGA